MRGRANDPNVQRAKVRRHAERTWTCACGKVCRGNGGKSSHQRACRLFNEGMLASWQTSLAKAEAGTRSGHTRSAELAREQIRIHQARLTYIMTRNPG